MRAGAARTPDRIQAGERVSDPPWRSLRAIRGVRPYSAAGVRRHAESGHEGGQQDALTAPHNGGPLQSVLPTYDPPDRVTQQAAAQLRRARSPACCQSTRGEAKVRVVACDERQVWRGNTAQLSPHNRRDLKPRPTACADLNPAPRLATKNAHARRKRAPSRVDRTSDHVARTIEPRSPRSPARESH